RYRTVGEKHRTACNSCIGGDADVFIRTDPRGTLRRQQPPFRIDIKDKRPARSIEQIVTGKRLPSGIEYGQVLMDTEAVWRDLNRCRILPHKVSPQSRLPRHPASVIRLLYCLLAYHWQQVFDLFKGEMTADRIRVVRGSDMPVAADQEIGWKAVEIRPFFWRQRIADLSCACHETVLPLRAKRSLHFFFG